MQIARGSEIVVGVSDCRIARPPASCLSTYALGSCIAVVVYDWRLRLGGMLHMLPESAIDHAPAGINPFRYADTGVPVLFQRMAEMGSGRNRVRCCLAGGARMMADSSHFEIGKRNYLALKKVLWRLGVFIDQEDVGGQESRSVRLELETGQIEIRKGAARKETVVAPGLNLIRRDADARLAR